MKTFIFLLATFISMQMVFAQPTALSAEKKTAAVDNLTVAIESENDGLQTSGAAVLSNLIKESYIESSDASLTLIPLLNMLKHGTTDEERIAAAFAIYQLDDKIGIYHLRGVAVFDENEKVATVCKNLYYSYHKLHGTEYLVSL
jgi:hypothetical protein